MHPLLNPTTHADLDLLATKLVDTHFFAGSQADCYLKLMLGVSLGFTTLESLHGVSVEDQKVIVNAALLERVLTRNGYILTANSSETDCVLEMTHKGRKIGTHMISVQGVAESNKRNITIAQACRHFLPDLFPIKFFVKAELPTTAKGLVTALSEKGINLQTADTLPAVAPKTDYVPDVDTQSEEFLSGLKANNRTTLLNWQNSIDSLDPENPGDWDAHRYTLGQMRFLNDVEMIDLLERFLGIAQSVGVGYNEAERRFFLTDMPALTE